MKQDLSLVMAGPLPGYNRTSPRPSPWRGGSSFCLMMKQVSSTKLLPHLGGEGDVLPGFETEIFQQIRLGSSPFIDFPIKHQMSLKIPFNDGFYR